MELFCLPVKLSSVWAAFSLRASPARRLRLRKNYWRLKIFPGFSFRIFPSNCFMRLMQPLRLKGWRPMAESAISILRKRILAERSGRTWRLRNTCRSVPRMGIWFSVRSQSFRLPATKTRTKRIPIRAERTAATAGLRRVPTCWPIPAGENRFPIAMMQMLFTITTNTTSRMKDTM